jgi:hypothetical protein
MTRPSASTRQGRLYCNKFDRWVDEEDATCTRPDDYCDFRDRCGIYFLMNERNRGANKRAKEERDASL